MFTVSWKGMEGKAASRMFSTSRPNSLGSSHDTLTFQILERKAAKDLCKNEKRLKHFNFRVVKQKRTPTKKSHSKRLQKIRGQRAGHLIGGGRGKNQK